MFDSREFHVHVPRERFRRTGRAGRQDGFRARLVLTAAGPRTVA